MDNNDDDLDSDEDTGQSWGCVRLIKAVSRLVRHHVDSGTLCADISELNDTFAL